MPEHIYSISEIREQITRLPEQFEQEPGNVALKVAQYANGSTQLQRSRLIDM